MTPRDVCVLGTREDNRVVSDVMVLSVQSVIWSSPNCEITRSANTMSPIGDTTEFGPRLSECHQKIEEGECKVV